MMLLIVSMWNKLHEHPEYGILGAIQAWFLAQFTVDYDQSLFHTLCVVAKDFGVLAGALVAIVSAFFQLEKLVLWVKTKRNGTKVN